MIDDGRDALFGFVDSGDRDALPGFFTVVTSPYSDIGQNDHDAADGRDDEYNKWYYDHCRENIRTPGFTRVSRYRINPIVVGKGVGPSREAVDPDAVLPGRGRVDRLLAELRERA